VALAQGRDILALKEDTGKNAHSSLLTIFIQEVFSETGKSFAETAAVIVSKGPGSYTGLRIGVSVAKGFCFAHDIPLLSISTLRGMAWGAAREIKEAQFIIPMIDARRMEVYSAVYDQQVNLVRQICAEIVDRHSFDAFLERGKTAFFGTGATKCRELFQEHPNALFPEKEFISAAHMAEQADQLLQDGLFEDLASFEPYYLKEFVAGKPKVKGLL